MYPPQIGTTHPLGGDLPLRPGWLEHRACWRWGKKRHRPRYSPADLGLDTRLLAGETSRQRSIIQLSQSLQCQYPDRLLLGHPRLGAVDDLRCFGPASTHTGETRPGCWFLQSSVGHPQPPGRFGSIGGVYHPNVLSRRRGDPTVALPKIAWHTGRYDIQMERSYRQVITILWSKSEFTSGSCVIFDPWLRVFSSQAPRKRQTSCPVCPYFLRTDPWIRAEPCPGSSRRPGSSLNPIPWPFAIPRSTSMVRGKFGWFGRSKLQRDSFDTVATGT